MNKIVKRILMSLGCAAFCVGLYTGYQAIEGWMDGKIAVADARVVEVERQNEEYRVEAEAEIVSLGVEIRDLTTENEVLSEENVRHEAVITTIETSVTELEEEALVLTDIHAKYSNAVAQIFEYKRIVAEYKQDVAVYKDRLITQESIILAQEQTIQHYKTLYENEQHLVDVVRTQLGDTQRRLTWEKVKFKGSAVIILAAGALALYGAVT